MRQVSTATHSRPRGTRRAEPVGGEREIHAQLRLAKPIDDGRVSHTKLRLAKPIANGCKPLGATGPKHEVRVGSAQGMCRLGSPRRSEGAPVFLSRPFPFHLSARSGSASSPPARCQHAHDFVDAFVAVKAAFFVEQFAHARAKSRGHAAHEFGHLLARKAVLRFQVAVRKPVE